MALLITEKGEGATASAAAASFLPFATIE
jgi:hypothetical protein